MVGKGEWARLLTLAAPVLYESHFPRLYLEDKEIRGTMEWRDWHLCRGFAGDSELQRIQVCEDALWRLRVSQDFPPLPEAELRLVAERIRSRLTTGQLP